MLLLVVVIGLAVAVVIIALWLRRLKRNNQDEIERHSLTPEALHRLLDSNRQMLVFDVRLPLDLLTSLEMIPGAKRIPPKELLENPSLIPKDKDSVVYCTCPSDKTSREVWQRARAMNFSRIKFLKGGLAGWKAKGYPVEPYVETFRLDTRA